MRLAVFTVGALFIGLALGLGLPQLALEFGRGPAVEMVTTGPLAVSKYRDGTNCGPGLGGLLPGTPVHVRQHGPVWSVETAFVVWVTRGDDPPLRQLTPAEATELALAQSCPGSGRASSIPDAGP